MIMKFSGHVSAAKGKKLMAAAASSAPPFELLRILEDEYGYPGIAVEVTMDWEPGKEGA